MVGVEPTRAINPAAFRERYFQLLRHLSITTILSKITAFVYPSSPPPQTTVVVFPPQTLFPPL